MRSMAESRRRGFRLLWSPPLMRGPTEEELPDKGGARDRPRSLGLCLGEERFRNGPW